MNSPLKGTNRVEKIGFTLIVLSLIFLLLQRQFEGGGLGKIMQQHELFFWFGLLIWAMGYMIREQAEKAKASEPVEDETQD